MTSIKHLTKMTILPALLLLALATGAQASNTESVSIQPEVAPKQMVQVSPQGHVVLHGTVASTSTTSFTVKSWGGDWTVQTTADTRLVSRLGGVITFGDLKNGDYVMVQGMMKPDAGLTLTAKTVKDQFTPMRTVSLRGTVTSLGTTSLTVKSVGGDWTVNVGAKTLLLARSGAQVTLSGFKIADAVIIRGILKDDASRIIEATRIQDMTLALRGVARKGEVSNLSGSTFTLVEKPHDRETKVAIEASTRITWKNESATTADLQNGMKVAVEGTLNTEGTLLTAGAITISNPPREEEHKDEND